MNGDETPGQGQDSLWEPAGRRARRIRGMLNGYTKGRRAALYELGRQTPTAFNEDLPA